MGREYKPKGEGLVRVFGNSRTEAGARGSSRRGWRRSLGLGGSLGKAEPWKFLGGQDVGVGGILPRSEELSQPCPDGQTLRDLSSWCSQLTPAAILHHHFVLILISGRVQGDFVIFAFQFRLVAWGINTRAGRHLLVLQKEFWWDSWH